MAFKDSAQSFLDKVAYNNQTGKTWNKDYFIKNSLSNYGATQQYEDNLKKKQEEEAQRQQMLQAIQPVQQQVSETPAKAPTTKKHQNFLSQLGSKAKEVGLNELSNIIKFQANQEKTNNKFLPNSLKPKDSIRSDTHAQNLQSLSTDLKTKAATYAPNTSGDNFLQKSALFSEEQIPTFAEFALLKKAPGMSGYNASTTELASKLTPIKNTVAKNIAQNAVKSGVDMGLYGGSKSAIEGNRPGQILKDTRDNAAGGLIFGGGASAIGEGLKIPSIIKDTKQKGIQQAFETKFGSPTINSPVAKNATTEIVNPNGKLKARNNVSTMIETPSQSFNTTAQTGERKFINNSVMNSNVAPEEMKKALQPQPYIKIKNVDTWENANNRVNTDHQTALKDFYGQKELKSADDTALGQALIVKAINEGRIADANDLSIDLAEKLTKAGQTVQAASIFKRLTPEGMLQYGNRKLNAANEELIKIGKQGNIKFTEEETKEIIDRMKKVQSMENGRTKDVEMGKINNIINNKIPSSLTDKVRAARNISLLGNIKTNVRNVGGNTLMGAADNLSNVVATPIDKLISLKTGQRTAIRPSISTQAKGFLEGGKTAISDSFGGLSKADLAGKTAAEKRALLKEGFLNPINTELNSNGKFELNKGLTFKNKPMRYAENAVGTALKVGDQTFKQGYYDDVLRQLMEGNKTNVATDEMKSIAEQIAKERTYQDENGVSKFLMGIKNAPQKIEGNTARQATQIAVDSILPYVKTPANILKRGVEYTPIGIAEGLSKTAKAIKAGDMLTQRQAVDRLGRGIVGTGLIGGGYELAKNGVATGAANKDKDVAAFNKQIGKQPYGLKLPNGKTLNYDWLQPVSMPFSAGVQMTQGKKGQQFKNAFESATNALNFYTDQPMLQSAQRLLGSQNDSKSTGQRLLESQLELPKQLVPTALKQIAQTKDSNVRSTYSPDFLQQALINPIKSKIPGQSETLEKKYDTFGREVKQYQGDNNLFNTAVNPGNITKNTSTPVDKLVLNVYNQTGDTTIFPRVAPKYITKGGKRYDLSSQEYADYQKNIGQETYKQFKGLLTDDYFNSLDSDSKAKIMKDIIDDVNKSARESFFDKRKIDY